jgi:hypothetical protein
VICIFALCAVGAAFAQQPAFYYSFDETLADATDNPYTLTSPNGHSFADGKYGKALSLDGTNQYLDLDVNGIVNTGTTPYTVCAWVYDESTEIPTSGTAENGAYFRDEIILAQKDGGGTGRITLYTRIETPTGGGDTRYFFNNMLGNTQNRSSEGAFKRGEWMHVAAVCNPADRTVTWYVNGKKDRTATAENAFEACSGGFRIGGHKANKDYWHGKIDELYLFTSLLSESEVQKIKNNTYFYTPITDRAGLEAIKDNLSGNYILENDIDLSGSNWAPLGDFTGTLDGNNHVISNMTPTPRDGAAFFVRIKENALVKNLGFEGAFIDGYNNVRCAVVAGYLEGAAVIENCYIANSTVKGRWCIGSFVGRAQNITGAAAVRNCYSSAFIYVNYDYSPADGNGHAGGIIGNIYYNGVNSITVENCYFSGIVHKENRRVNEEGQIAGVIGWNGHDGSNASSIVKNNVNLAPYLLSPDGKHRISSQRSDNASYGNPTPGPNYSLSTTVVSVGNGWENTSAIIAEGSTHYGDAKKDGTNIPNGDANAKAATFYSGIGWNFTDTWKIDEGNTYPVLKWTDATRPNFVVVNTAPLSLTAGVSVDLSKRIFSGRGLGLTFTPNSDKIAIENGVVSFAQPSVSAFETVTVSVQEGTLTPAYTIEIALIPEIASIAVPADLEQVRNFPSAKFVLTADLDMSGIEFTPLPDFSGEFDGNNHVIYNLTPTAKEGTAFFTRIKDNAIVKNLGFENANVDGGWNVRIAVLTGYMAGNALIENCYIANSTVKGRWHVGSFVGRMDGNNTVIRNCYSSAYLSTPTGTQNTDDQNTGHIAGIVGVLNAGGCRVENCYFSGVIQRNPSVQVPNEGQTAGIVAWNNNAGNIITKNVNLAPYLLSNTGKYRISSVQGNPGPGGNDPSGPNYSLSTTVVSVVDDWENTSAVVAIDNEQYGQNKRHGLNIPDGDANAKAAAFYSEMDWDFTDTWTIDEGNAYPVLKWTDATRPNFVVVNSDPISLSADAPVDLSKRIFSGRGLGLTFTPSSNKIKIVNGVVSIDQPIAAVETVTVSVQEGTLTPAYTIEISLMPGIVSIATPEDLELLRNYPTAKYALTADLDLSGIDNFTPLPNFTGTLDGQGHIIYNLTIDEREPAAFFNTISGSAVIKNLGFENALITDATHARTAVLTGFIEGSALIENCYIANSTVKGRWCVGSFVGRSRNTSGAVIRNCYSSAYLYTPDYDGGAGHTGGIIGNIFAEGITVENCYFSGIIQRVLGNNAEGEVSGIVGWNGTGGPGQTNVISTIKNNVNLAPYLLSNYGKRRIAGSIQNQNGGEPNPGPNYSLSTTVVSAYGDWGNTSAIIAEDSEQYGAAKKDGLNIPDGDENAKVQDFYETTLGWNFTDLWEIETDGSYPRFQWADVTRPHFVVVPQAITLTVDAPVDLSKYIFSGRGLDLTFTTTSDKITITDGSIVSAQAISAEETVVVSVQEGELTQTYSLEISLKPLYSLTVGTFTGGTVTADKVAYLENETVTLTIAASEGYELESISVHKTGDTGTTVTLEGDGNARTFAMPAYDVTVAATFTAIEYIITYDLDGGTNHADNPATYTIEDTPITLAAPTKDD